MTRRADPQQGNPQMNPVEPRKRHLASTNTTDLNPVPNPAEPRRTPLVNPVEPRPPTGFNADPGTDTTAAQTRSSGVQRGSTGFPGPSPRTPRTHTRRRAAPATSAPARTVTSHGTRQPAPEPAASTDEMPPAPAIHPAAASADGTATAGGTSTAARAGGISSAPITDLALYRIPDTMRLLSLSRSVIYEQIRAGRLRTVHQGRACLIPARAIADYIALLENEAQAEGAA
jgi:hypothetical protein